MTRDCPQRDKKNMLPLKELRIDSDTINNLECIFFHGKITIVSENDEVIPAVEILEKNRIIGFDTESRPAFFKGQKFPVALIQMAVEDEAFIFQLRKIGFHPTLKKLLENKNVTKIGVAVHDDIKRLQDMGAFTSAGFVDLASIAKSKGLIQTGLRSLTARYLGKKLVKGSQKTNWSRLNLSDTQLRYASTDAWVCLQLLELLSGDKTDYFALRQAEAIALAEPEGTGE